MSLTKNLLGMLAPNYHGKRGPPLPCPSQASPCFMTPNIYDAQSPLWSIMLYSDANKNFKLRPWVKLYW